MLRPIVLLALILGLAGCYDSSRPTRIGSAAPDFVVQDSDRKVALHDFKGQVVVLNFWATWCAPCIEEMPSLIDMAQRVKDKGVTVVGVSIDVDGGAYHNFIKQHGVDFLTVRDPDQKSSSLYGTTGWPETFIIDRQGVLRRKFVGPVNWNDPEIVQYLTSL
ncbi:MAG TPA: TlpA disulfide reductase family protein [Terriglobales bacterium]|nr:TlpA disulfide reductase family protein [Terriglobales bacterium]